MAKTGRSAARARAEQARLARERAARRARRERTAWWWIAAGPAVLLLLIIIKVSIPSPSPGGDSPGGGDNAALSAATLAALAPSSSTLDSVGKGQGVTLPRRIDGQPGLTDGGKPLVLYVGAEYCPFCASQRWPLVIALNRFGSFSGLTASHSASDDVYPDTATVSFHGSTYTSEFLAFQGVELNTNERVGRGYEPLDELTGEQELVFSTYNAPPYAQAAGSIPFLDLGNRYLQTGTSISPELMVGLSHDEIALELADNPTGPVAQAVLGSANAFTAALCVLTDGQPGDVCTSAAATAYQAEVSGD